MHHDLEIPVSISTNVYSVCKSTMLRFDVSNENVKDYKDMTI